MFGSHTQKAVFAYINRRTDVGWLFTKLCIEALRAAWRDRENDVRNGNENENGQYRWFMAAWIRSKSPNAYIVAIPLFSCNIGLGLGPCDYETSAKSTNVLMV